MTYPDINIDRFEGEAKVREPRFFRCSIWPCKNRIEEGDEYRDDRERTGKRFCLICGNIYAKDAPIRICTEEDCE